MSFAANKKKWRVSGWAQPPLEVYNLNNMIPFFVMHPQINAFAYKIFKCLFETLSYIGTFVELAGLSVVQILFDKVRSLPSGYCIKILIIRSIILLRFDYLKMYASKHRFLQPREEYNVGMVQVAQDDPKRFRMELTFSRGADLSPLEVTSLQRSVSKN